MTSISLLAQKTTSVHGKVLDAVSKEALPYATVQLFEANLGTRTDIDGNFRIDGQENTTQLRVSYVGYTTQIVAIQAGQHNEITGLCCMNPHFIRPSLTHKRSSDFDGLWSGDLNKFVQ